MNQQAEDLLMGAPSEVTAEAVARASHPAQSAAKLSSMNQSPKSEFGVEGAAGEMHGVLF